jgi:ankyrin repeat protein
MESAIERTENEYDILLRKELTGDNPNEATIRELVKQGADITGEFLIDAIFCYTNTDKETSLDIRYFKLFIELGADVNYVDDGFNCLFEASLSWNSALVELLIDAGANVNCTNTDTHESLLDTLILELHSEEQRRNCGVEPLRLILDRLNRCGAKRTND